MLPALEESKATPLQALVLVALIYLGASAIIATARRYGFGDQARVLADCFYLCCGLLVVQHRAMSIAQLRSAGVRGAGFSVVLGLLCGATVLFVVLSRLNDGGVTGSASMTTEEILHSVLAAPVSEEMLFTGFLFIALRARLALFTSACIVAVVFTLGHLPNHWVSFGIRFIYITASCLLFERFRSLPLNMTAHSLMNGLPVLVGHFPGLYQPMVLHLSSSLPYLGAASTFVALLLSVSLTRQTLLKRPMPRIVEPPAESAHETSADLDAGSRPA